MARICQIETGGANRGGRCEGSRPRLRGQRIELAQSGGAQAGLMSARAFRWAVPESETTNGAQVTRLEYARARSNAFFQFDRNRRRHYTLHACGNDDAATGHFISTCAHQ